MTLQAHAAAVFFLGLILFFFSTPVNLMFPFGTKQDGFGKEPEEFSCWNRVTDGAYNDNTQCLGPVSLT